MVFEDRIKRTSKFHVYRKRARGTRPLDQKLNFPAAARFSQHFGEFLAAFNVFLIDPDNNVARTQFGQRRRRPRPNRGQQNPQLLLENLSQMLFVPSASDERSSRREFHSLTYYI